MRGRPVMVRNTNAVFRPEDYRERTTPKAKHGPNLRDLLPTPSVNLSHQRIIERMTRALDEQGQATVLVVGGGQQRAKLDPILTRQMKHRVVYIDIDTDADVDIFCDAHDLPFPNGRFDAVITTAVLEHVVDPNRVASEMARILRPGGLIYSELPFMQQVHEGAYDFTRFTLGGHRRLLNNFHEIDSGMTAGPATALVWAIENFLLSFSNKAAVRKATKIISRLVFWPIKYMDYWLKHEPAAMDAASCTYFYGARSDTLVRDEDIIARYVGAKRMSHV